METYTPANGRMVISRSQEEKWAVENCRLTKILGWSLIATFCFTVVTSLLHDRLQVDFLMLIGGIAILKGSQAWLRFYIYTSVFSVIVICVSIAYAYLVHEPFEVNRKWVDHRDSEFWYDYVGEMGIFIGLACLSIFTLKVRKLVFWTKATKRWGGGIIIASLVLSSISAASKLTTPNQDEVIATELPILRQYVQTSGTTFSSAAMDPIKAELRKNPAILEVDFGISPNGSMVFYTKSESSHPGDWDYQEFVKGPGGRWVEIKVRLQQ